MREIRTRFEEIFKVRRREYEHFARAIAAEEIIALAGPGHFDPTSKILLFLFWFLREKIVGDAQRHLALAMQFIDDGVILRVILEATAGVNDAGQAEPVQFAHEMARGIQLVFRRQLRTFGERGVKNGRVGARNEQPGGIALLVALDFATRRIRRVLRVTASAQRRFVQQRAAIQMQNENRRIRRGGVDFLQASAFGVPQIEIQSSHRPRAPIVRAACAALVL